MVGTAHAASPNPPYVIVTYYDYGCEGKTAPRVAGLVYDERHANALVRTIKNALSDANASLVVEIWLPEWFETVPGGYALGDNVNLEGR